MGAVIGHCDLATRGVVAVKFMGWKVVQGGNMQGLLGRLCSSTGYWVIEVVELLKGSMWRVRGLYLGGWPSTFKVGTKTQTNGNWSILPQSHHWWRWFQCWMPGVEDDAGPYGRTMINVERTRQWVTYRTNIQNHTRLVSSAGRTSNLGRKAFRLDNIVWWLMRWRDRISDLNEEIWGDEWGVMH